MPARWLCWSEKAWVHLLPQKTACLQHYLVWLLSLSFSLWDRYEWPLWDDDSLLLGPVCEREEGVCECEEGVCECVEGVCLETALLSVEEEVCLEDEELLLVLDFWLLEGVESCFNLQETFCKHRGHTSTNQVLQIRSHDWNTALTFSHNPWVSPIATCRAFYYKSTFYPKNWYVLSIHHPHPSRENKTDKIKWERRGTEGTWNRFQ